MEPRLVKPPGQDPAVERLKSRYGLAGSAVAEERRRRAGDAREEQAWPGFNFSALNQAKCKRRSPTSPDDFDTYSSGDKVGSASRCYSDENKYCRTPLIGSFKHLNINCLDDDLESFRELKQLETEELIENDHRVTTSNINKLSFKETKKAIAQPISLTSNSRNCTEYFSDACDSPLKHTASPTSKGSNKQPLLPHQINQIYDELFQIHQKLQASYICLRNFN